MFAHLAAVDTMRDLAPIPLPEVTGACANTFNRQRGFAFVLTCALRTVGTCLAELQQSFDKGVTWAPASESVLLDANEDEAIFLIRGVPTYLRFSLTPAGGFDGSVRVEVRSSDSILCEPA